MSLPQFTEMPACFRRFGNPGAQTRMRLYCFAHAGGTAATYAPWARLLAPEIEVCAVEQPGHGTRMDEEPLADVPAMAQQLLLPFCQLQADRKPFAFYGHSLGAVVAYETALALQELDYAAGQARSLPGPLPLLTLQHLFVGAVRAPHLPPMLPPLAHLDEERFLAGVQDRYGGISDAVLAEPELLEMILPPLRADFAAYESYRHQANRSLACPVTAFAGTLDPVVSRVAVAAWADHTSGPFRFHTVPGDHFFLAEHREQVLGIVARALRAATEQAAPGEAENTAGGEFDA